MSLRGADVTGLMRLAAQAMAGHSEDELTELGERLFVQRIAGMVYPEARALVRAHQRLGHTLVLASSATPYQAAPLARDLGFQHLLCSRVEAVRGVITGNVLGRGRTWPTGAAPVPGGGCAGGRGSPASPPPAQWASASACSTAAAARLPTWPRRWARTWPWRSPGCG